MRIGQSVTKSMGPARRFFAPTRGMHGARSNDFQRKVSDIADEDEDDGARQQILKSPVNLPQHGQIGNESLEDVNADVDKNEEKLKEDYFWNYKCCEFYIDSLFELSLNFEKFGNGAGMYIISKMMLPILYALGHSNYSNSVHRFICRVLSSTTPREAMLLVSERFSNREGKEGGNIFKDRRVEFRIRILKKLLSNMGPNINSESIQKVNSVIDIKEKLFHHAREVHGVIIRSGEHKERSELKDYQLIMETLNQMKADQTVPGRKFGGLTYPENLLDSDKFNKARFYRWLTQKNRDAVGVFRGQNPDLPFL